MDKATAFKVARLVFAVTVRDGKLTEAETAFMDRVNAKLGLPTGRDSWAMPITDPESSIAELKALPPDVQQETFRLLVEAAAVDGVVHAAERHLLEAAAEAIGGTRAQVDQWIAYALTAPKP